jgi:hypothetical protein
MSGSREDEGRASRWRDLLHSAEGPDHHRELETALQHGAPARLSRLPPAGPGGVRARPRMAGCAIPASSAGHANRSAPTNHERPVLPIQSSPRSPHTTLSSPIGGRRAGGFPSRVDHTAHMSTRQYARLVDEWVTGIGLRREDYGRTRSAERRPRSSTSRPATCGPCRSCSDIRRLRAPSVISALISSMHSPSPSSHQRQAFPDVCGQRGGASLLPGGLFECPRRT